jgi:hypothetical protein
MSLRVSIRLLFLLATISICTTVLHANEIIAEISGSLPFAVFNVTETSTNLRTSTTFTVGDSLTSGPGSGDFSIVPIGTSFGGFSLTDTAISTGGGFSISNPSYGSFAATGGSIQHETTSALVADLTGTFTPEGLLSGFAAAPASVTLAFTQNGASISASFTLNAAPIPPIPEPATILTIGIGLCGTALVLRRKVRRKLAKS